MPKSYTNIRVERGARDKLAALAERLGVSLIEIVSILAEIDPATILTFSAERKRRETVLKMILDSSQKGAAHAKARGGDA